MAEDPEDVLDTTVVHDLRDPDDLSDENDVAAGDVATIDPDHHERPEAGVVPDNPEES